ncbi:hypothetical protein CPC08DRAFT_771579 [Agrocybe pediades]|nr:hypothetical protein CPC08DRAFT_771579 [Agrocybe pediades]
MLSPRSPRLLFSEKQRRENPLVPKYLPLSQANTAKFFAFSFRPIPHGTDAPGLTMQPPSAFKRPSPPSKAPASSSQNLPPNPPPPKPALAFTSSSFPPFAGLAALGSLSLNQDHAPALLHRDPISLPAPISSQRGGATIFSPILDILIPTNLQSPSHGGACMHSPTTLSSDHLHGGVSAFLPRSSSLSDFYFLNSTFHRDPPPPLSPSPPVSSSFLFEPPDDFDSSNYDTPYFNPWT